jgi:protein-L-isoaspartate(D-aspartate) O-methyltransferase
MFIPVGGYSQYIWVIDKKENGSIERRREFGVRYVPLTDAPKE